MASRKSTQHFIAEERWVYTKLTVCCVPQQIRTHKIGFINTQGERSLREESATPASTTLEQLTEIAVDSSLDYTQQKLGIRYKGNKQLKKT